MSQLKNSLASSEWFLVLSLLAILSSLVLIAKINTHQASVLIETQKLESEALIPVTIEGAVAKPGTYQIKAGVTLGQALKKARPKPQANLKELDLTQRIKAPLNLVLEELKEITVFIDGAVEIRQEFRLPLKTRVCDLKTKVQCTSDADPELIKAFWKKRRELKDGEILWVPKKSVE